MNRLILAFGLSFSLLGVAHATGIPNREFKTLEKQLKRAAKQGAWTDARSLLQSISKDDSTRALELIQSVGSKTPRPRIYRAAAEAIGSMRSAEVHNAIVAQLRKAKPRTETFLLLDALGAARTPDALESLTLLFTHKNPTLVRGALAQLDTSALSAVPALIELLADCEGKPQRLQLRGMTETKLHTITKKSFPNAEAWREFWKESAEGFKPTLRASKLELPFASGTLFETPIVSESLLILLDVSSSMEAKRMTPLGARPGPRKPLDGPERRFDYAKEAVRQFVRTLSPRVRFNLIAYSGIPHPIFSNEDPFELAPEMVGEYSARLHRSSKKLVKANDKKAAELSEFLDTLRTSPGGTLTLTALRYALRVESVDTIVLISDGASSELDQTTGQELDADDVLTVFRSANRKRRVVVHTFGFGLSRQAQRRGLPRRGGAGFRPRPADPFDELMRGLAKQTGGGCTSIQ